MKTKRYFNQILKPYKTIVKEITGDYTTIRVTTGEKFCCYCRPEYHKEIEVPIYEDILGNQAFNRKMQKRLQEYNIKEKYSSEILSFLHEIGHIYTYSKINDIIYVKMATLIQKIQRIFYKSEKITNWLFNRYFNLALEKNADKWAMEYIKNNQEQVQKWQVMLRKNYDKYLIKAIKALGE